MRFIFSLIAMASAVSGTALEARSPVTVTLTFPTPGATKTDAPACTAIGPAVLTTDMPILPTEVRSALLPLSTTFGVSIEFVTQSTATYTLAIQPDWTDLCQISTLLPTTVQPAYSSFATSAQSWFNVHSSAVMETREQCRKSWSKINHTGHDDLVEVILAASCLGKFKAFGNATATTNGALGQHASVGAAVLVGLAGMMAAMAIAF